MNVRELAEWLLKFEDQEAEVEIVFHTSGSGYYDQGGNATIDVFDPGNQAHYTYTDLRGNRFVKPDAPYANKRTLLLGGYNE